jgi:ABC-type phosphate/phosphonate transport system ATPase subunit
VRSIYQNLTFTSGTLVFSEAKFTKRATDKRRDNDTTSTYIFQSAQHHNNANVLKAKECKNKVEWSELNRIGATRMANQNEKILMELLDIEENDKCCDCGSRGLFSFFF